jgi:hypothetical protein
MTFDPKGTQPGLANQGAKEPPLVHMKCRQEDCDSMRAQEIPVQSGMPNAGAAHNRMYRCVKCANTWSMSVGGYVPL